MSEGKTRAAETEQGSSRKWNRFYTEREQVTNEMCLLFMESENA